MNKRDWKRIALGLLIADYMLSTAANLYNRSLIAKRDTRITDLERQVNYYIGKLTDAEVPLSAFDEIVVNEFNRQNNPK